MMRYIVLDTESVPALVVHCCDDGKEANELAQRYSTQNGRPVSVFETKGSKVFGPVALAGLKFATPEDARRAGFPPSSGDEGK